MEKNAINKERDTARRLELKKVFNRFVNVLTLFGFLVPAGCFISGGIDLMEAMGLLSGWQAAILIMRYIITGSISLFSRNI